MKKLFLTSGVILCMACPALATTDIDYSNGTYTAGGETPTCIEDITGQEADNSDAAFEARWTPLTYTIAYAKGTAGSHDANYITGSVASTTGITFESTNFNLATEGFTATGYNLTGWESPVDLTNGNAPTSPATYVLYPISTQMNYSTFASETVCPVASYGYAAPEPNRTVTLTAHWEPQTYNVRYMKGNTNLYVHTNGAVYDAAYSIPAAANTAAINATPTGYTFIGWTRDSSPVVTRDSGSGAVNTGTVANAWTGTNQWTEVPYIIMPTVYAAYMPMQYNITYAAGDSANDGTGMAATGTTNPTVATYDAETTLATNAFTLTGYGFNGWSCENNSGSITGLSYSNGQTVNSWNVASDLTCTAQWAAGTTAVTYSCGSDADITGTAPSGTNLDTATYDSLYAFATNSGNCAKPGYTFQGWSCTGLNGTKTAGSSMTWNYTGASTTCTAVYGANTINLTWYNDTAENEGTAMPVEQTAQSCLYDSTIDIPDNEPTKTGYTFEGWRVRAASNNQNP